MRMLFRSVATSCQRLRPYAYRTTCRERHVDGGHPFIQSCLANDGGGDGFREHHVGG